MQENKKSNKVSDQKKILEELEEELELRILLNPLEEFQLLNW